MGSTLTKIWKKTVSLPMLHIVIQLDLGMKKRHPFGCLISTIYSLSNQLASSSLKSYSIYKSFPSSVLAVTSKVSIS